jgi:mannose-6-phosphate isomerase-like protein (cupin superfamily)
MNEHVRAIAERIRGLRMILDIPTDEMARVCDTTEEDYIAHETGEIDFSFTFLYKCSKHFGVDITELITGDKPTLSFYSVTRSGEGLPIERRKGFKYQHLAPFIKDKISEPFLVTAKYDEDAQKKEIALSFHEGQEFDYILSGTLKVRLEDHIEYLKPGDSIYYNSAHGHGMIAVNGEDCTFIAVVIGKN